MFSLLFVVPFYAKSITLWVGESYKCEASTVGLVSDVSWTTNGGYFTLTGSGLYRDVKISQYFSGTASVTCTWKYRLYSGDTYKTNSKTWSFSCRSNPVSISPSSMTLSVGEDAYVGYTHAYSNSYLSYAGAYFTSSNPSVATVSSSGYVYAKSPGTTYINVYSKISDVSPYCMVTVEQVDPTSVSIPSSLNAYVGESTSLTASLYPSNATTSLSWYTSNSQVATVSSLGVVTGVGEGSATIYTKTSNGIYSNDCNVNVAYRKPTSVSLSSAMELIVGNTKQLSATVTPSNAKTTLTWMSSNTDVATVSSSGLVTAISGGEAKITVSTDNGYSASCNVTVKPLPQEVLLPAEITLPHKSTTKLNVEVMPANAYTEFSWSSSNNEVATVSQKGEVTALYPGETDIVVTTSNGLVATCRVEVPIPTYYVVVWFKEEGYITYPFAHKPVITYIGDEICVETSSESVSFKQADVEKVTLENTSTPAGIEEVENDVIAPEIMQANNQIKLSDFTPGTNVCVYTINGQLVAMYEIEDDGSLLLSFANLQKGIYIIQANNLTHKFIIK